MHPPHTAVLGVPCIVDVFYDFIHPLPVCSRKSNCSLDRGVSVLNRAGLDVNKQLDVFLLAHDRVRASTKKRAGLRFDELELLQWEVGLEECILCMF